MEGQQVAVSQSKCRKKRRKAVNLKYKKGRKKIFCSRDFLVRFSPFSFPFFNAVVFFFYFTLCACVLLLYIERLTVCECTINGGAVEGTETERKVPFLWKRKFKKRSRKRKSFFSNRKGETFKSLRRPVEHFQLSSYFFLILKTVVSSREEFFYKNIKRDLHWTIRNRIELNVDDCGLRKN